MRFSLVATATTLLGASQAHITGISVPATIKPGDTIEVIVKSSKWTELTYDVGIVFGYTTGKVFPDAINNPVDSFYLGPKGSNQIHDFKKTITIPKTAPKGPGLISASLQTLEGAYYFPYLHNYNVSVTFGSKTSKAYKTSK